VGLLDGKVGIVTGAGSGIGRATAARMASEGAQVVVADINLDTAKETVVSIEDAGGEAIAQWVDVSDEGAVEAMTQAAVDTFGRLDCIHNNAANVGIVPRDLDLVNMDVEVWDATLNVNLKGAMLGCKHSVPRMLASGGGGAIVNASSASGQFGDLNRMAYGVSKAGIDSLTRYVATLHGKDGIRCNSLAPGVVDTPALTANVPVEQIEMFLRSAVTPTLGKPDDIAGVVVFLVSDEARFITGQVINADGGMTMHNPLYGELIAGT
jgi:NAD(P)-dependent dehydrogenase (short-subunit alcohol dehydrogenase family)